MDVVIYHIPGWKVGCTNDLERRRTEYPEGTELEVIEELFDVTPKEAGDVERAWAKLYGYDPGWHYAVSYQGRLNNVAKRGTGFFTMSSEEHRRYGAMARPHLANLTFKERSELNRRSAHALVTCRYCGKVGKKCGMARWHNERCKHK